MPKFQFKAINMSGKIMEGIYEAQNQQAVIELIRQKSYYHLEVKEIVERKDVKELQLFSKIKIKDISIYCRQFASILRAGMPLIKCLGMLAEQTENKSLKAITHNVREEVQKGSSLSQAMSAHTKKIPPILINMIAAGEASGTLDNSLEVMAEHFEKEHKTKSKVKNAMRYPIIVSIVAVIVVVIMLIFVIPTFKGIFNNAGAELPLPTKMLLAMSEFLQHHGIAMLGGVIVLVLIFKMYVSGAARFARTMSTLLTTGVSITETLDITGKVMDNVYVTGSVMEIIEQVKQGRGLYAPMKSSGIYPVMLENMVMMGEESGTLDTMLTRAAEFYEDEVDRGAAALTSMIEPLVIVVLGGIIAFIVISIMLPMFEMTSLVA